jgi:hypothetical protein
MVTAFLTSRAFSFSLPVQFHSVAIMQLYVWSDTTRETHMLDDDEKPLDPELRAKAQARLEEEKARFKAMTREEIDAYCEKHRLRLIASDIEWEECREARAPSAPETSPLHSFEAPSHQCPVTSELCAAALNVLRENPDTLRAAVRDVLHEMAEERKRDG